MRQSAAQPDQGDEQRPAPERLQVVRFRLGEGHYGIDIRHVLEICRVTALTRVPQSAPGVRGVINLRGSIIPVLDPGVLLEIEPAPISAHSRIIVMDLRGRTVGLLVDAAHEVTHIGCDRIAPASECHAGVDARRIAGVARLDDGLLILLAPEGLLEDAGLATTDEDRTQDQTDDLAA